MLGSCGASLFINRSGEKHAHAWKRLFADFVSLPSPLFCAAACAAAGDADKAFQLYAEMKATGVPADRMVYSSVVKACAERIERLPPSERCAGAHAVADVAAGDAVPV